MEKGKSYEKTLNLRLSKEEHAAIKIIATKEGIGIKKLIIDMLNKIYPEWREANK